MEEIVIEVPLVPPSVNHYWQARGRRRFLSQRGRVWKETVHDIVFATIQRSLLNTFWGERVEVIAHLRLGRKKRDVDNCLKAICDSIKGVVIEDDEQIDTLTVEKEHGHNKQSTTIVIRKRRLYDGTGQGDQGEGDMQLVAGEPSVGVQESGPARRRKGRR